MQRATFETIDRLSDERSQLLALAGHQRLTRDQAARVDEITARLAIQWDQLRREVAADSRDSQEREASRARHAAEFQRGLAERIAANQIAAPPHADPSSDVT